MINPKEIRIGNTIYDRHGNITHVHAGWFYLTQDPKRLEDYSPIPLTPEILEKCKFTEFYRSEWQIKYEYQTKRYDIIVVFKSSRIMLFYGATYLKDIESLHDLQNIIYSLTGEELEVKELANLTTY